MQKISLKLQQIGSKLKNIRLKRPTSWGFETMVVDGKRVVRISAWWWLITIAVVIALMSYLNYLRVPKELRESQKDFATTMTAVGKLYQMPSETPVLATVTDKASLADQPFFDLAENGDKLLVFQTSQKVILYRPSTKKIINFSNLNPTQATITTQSAPAAQTTPLPSAPVETPAAVPVQPATITINNGTTVAGLTQKVQQRLQSVSSSASVIARGNAAKNTYAETVVVAVTPAGERVAGEIARTLGGRTASLPEGESAPTSDILIIAGTDATR